MSHFTKLAKADIISADAFISAAKELGFKCTRNGKSRGWAGRTMDADVVVNLPGKYDLALVARKGQPGKFDLIAEDFLQVPETMARKGIRGLTAMAERFSQLTTKHTIISKYRKQGFRARATEDNDGNINLALERY